jgi:hypothetical protein
MRKYFLIPGIAILGFLILFYISNMFAPGSYPYAERYELPVDEPTLVALINSFKDENPEYKVPDPNRLKDERIGANGHWYRIYLYYPKENQIVYIWTRPAGKKKTTLALVGFGYGLRLENWQLINKDFTSTENDEQKRKFEERILSKIREKIKK